MQNNENIKYYVSSDGTQIPLKDVEFTHLSNGYAKKLRNIFESSNKDEYYSKLKELNDIKEEIYSRLNQFESSFEENTSE